MLDDSQADAVAARERLSALADGELDGNGALQACTNWRESAESRQTWHAYQLIGDVLRSEDLARHPVRDAAFLDALRQRLANEPVVLAPQRLEPAASVSLPVRGARLAAGGQRRWAWMAPTAVAAGFVAVAGVLTITRPGLLPTPTEAPLVAQTASPVLTASTTPATPAPVPPAPEPQTFVASGELIRDARLDRYLAAHKQFAGSSALGVPSAYLRNATAESSGR